jgi:hypothetical protein
LAQYLFSVDAVLGMLTIGDAALYGVAYASKSLWAAFLPIFVPFSALWVLFCYGAYKGLVGANALLKVVFWLFVAGHLVVFPVGTAIAGVCIWLRRELSPYSSGLRVEPVAQQGASGDGPRAAR